MNECIYIVQLGIHWNSLSGNWCYHCCHECSVSFQVAGGKAYSLSYVIIDTHSHPQVNPPIFSSTANKEETATGRMLAMHETIAKDGKEKFTLVIITCGIFSISDDKRDEPHITEEVLHSCIFHSSGYINLHIFTRQLKKHNIPEDMFDDTWSDTRKTGILFMHDEDEAEYMLFRLGEIENGFQILYRCLRETQDVCHGHGTLADDLERIAREGSHFQ